MEITFTYGWEAVTPTHHKKSQPWNIEKLMATLRKRENELEQAQEYGLNDYQLGMYERAVKRAQDAVDQAWKEFEANND